MKNSQAVVKSTVSNVTTAAVSTQCKPARLSVDSIGIDAFIEKLMRVGRTGQGMRLVRHADGSKRHFYGSAYAAGTGASYLHLWRQRLRGNHETQLVNRIYGFYEELNRRYCSPRLYNMFQDVFNVMPLTALVGERILCMHGGLSPELLNGKSLDVLRDIIRPLPDPPNPSLPLDLLWADPDARTAKFKFSIRGVSCTFGTDVVNSICEKYGLDLICRAHQVVQDGYEFFANRKLVTIFSTPHYCGQFDNAAAVMHVNKDLLCSFKIFRPKFPKAGKSVAIKAK
ncbi:hypothetical protein QR680_007749 [Steinernema hermaphroditum]|uniref:Serine/threonine-protein phosphatase n=1 Tax=Steinernema hermaphroditum TaxID=289476 RepID=A0AA39M5U8_9BILA|nr:hypothetical protein QR680_007749 [Steinernema hermaphroditum]